MWPITLKSVQGEKKKNRRKSQLPYIPSYKQKIRATYFSLYDSAQF